MNIRTKQFHILTDIGLVWKLMTDVYNHEESNGPAAPFFEYAIISSWLDKDYVRWNRFWLDGDMPVGFVFYEQPVTSIWFVLRPGYEFLAGDMIEYVETAYPKFDEPLELSLTSGQTALIEEAQRRGYHAAYEEADYIFDFRKGKLDYPLPEGYHFVDARSSDPLKSARCLWNGFNSEELGDRQDARFASRLVPEEVRHADYAASRSAHRRHKRAADAHELFRKRCIRALQLELEFPVDDVLAGQQQDEPGIEIMIARQLVIEAEALRPAAEETRRDIRQ